MLFLCLAWRLRSCECENHLPRGRFRVCAGVRWRWTDMACTAKRAVCLCSRNAFCRRGRLALVGENARLCGVWRRWVCRPRFWGGNCGGKRAGSVCSHVDERILSYRFLALYLVIGIMGASRLHLLMDVPESALPSAFLLLILLGIMACGDVSRHFRLEQAISACVGIAAVVCGDAAGSVAGLALSPLVTAHTSGVVEAAMMVSVIAVVTVRLFVFTEWDLAELFLGDGALLTADQVPLAAEEAAALISERSGLSERQQQVLPYLLRGDSMARIAQATSLSVSTVQTHAHNIYKKCGVRGKQDLILLFDSWQRRCSADEDSSAEQ